MEKEIHVFGSCGEPCLIFVENGWNVIRCEKGISLSSKKGNVTVGDLCFECHFIDEG